MKENNSYEVYVGVDVCKDFYTTTVIFAKDKITFKVKSNPVKFEKILSKHVSFVPKNKVVITMEQTSKYHLPLAEHLYEKGYAVKVVNPYSVKSFARAKLLRAKTDKVDSDVIAEYGRVFDTVRLFKPKSEVQKQIEVRLKMIENFQKQKTMLINQIEAFRYMPMQGKEEIIDEYEGLIKVLNDKIRKVELQIERLCRENYPREYKLLISIPGISSRGASMILSVLRGFEGFERAKQLGSYLGICPSPKESGSSVKGQGRISKRGSPYGRKIMYLCGLSAIRVNRYCKELYERLINKGKSKCLALIAVAYKLLRQAFGVLKRGEPFRDDFLIAVQ